MIELKKEITFGRVQDETLIVNSATHKGLKLNKQGTDIWNLYCNGMSVEQIKTHFLSLFPTQSALVCQDIDNFFNILKKEEII